LRSPEAPLRSPHHRHPWDEWIGFGIAESFADLAPILVIADVNPQRAQQAADKLRQHEARIRTSPTAWRSSPGTF
jgi:hypothetical protein